MTIQDMGSYSSPPYDEEEAASVAVGTSAAVVLVTSQDRANESGPQFEDEDFLPLLSSKYRYCKWHELDDVDVRGNMLKSPRVRRAPKGYKLEAVRKLELEEGMENSDEEDHRQLHVPLRRRKAKRTNHFRNKMENWENAESVNLSYQDLGHPFQKKEFLRVLRRLIRCENIQLMDNALKDLNSVGLPRCTHLYLQRNYISDLRKLPKVPMLEHLSLQQNSIESLAGLELLRKTNIKSLILKGNPIELDPHYRQMVFKVLPDLLLLDGVPKLESDVEDSLQATIARTCIVS
ncbi:acidic leucine-rich nuclear phosphoprotein 32 family member A [Nematostella vectensis]|uniref:acidic leucine-rich nuclear phosphoprotein 32 family member A n=1 Tax=Nematostella vectensis TaxID=45351 RepID=UPI001390414A|nr:acidic leucine-rich nuclear phosphoprotein 32 family member A [Nematostella vectensis]